jgi:hypothetical protein
VPRWHADAIILADDIDAVYVETLTDTFAMSPLQR